MKSLRLRLCAIGVVGATVAVVPILTPLGGAFVHADEISDQRARVQQLTDMLEQLQEDADVLAEQWHVANDELAELEAEVTELEADVAEQEDEVASLQGDLGEVAVRAYMGAGSNGLGPIFGSTSDFTADLQRQELSKVALASGTATSDDLERELNELADAKEQLETRRNEVEDKRDEVADAQSAARERKAEYTEARQKAESELGQLIREEEERRARESYERAMAEARAAEAAARARQQQAQQVQAQQNATTARPASGGGGGGGNAPAAPAVVAAPAAPATPAAPAAPAAPPRASTQAGTAVAAAKSQMGVAYRFAAASPGEAFDCSGLTSWAWGRAGVSMPHQSAQQYASLPHISASQLQPGDLVFYYSPISHVGMYIGGGQMIHAPNSGSTVSTTSVNFSKAVGFARPG